MCGIWLIWLIIIGVSLGSFFPLMLWVGTDSFYSLVIVFSFFLFLVCMEYWRWLSFSLSYLARLD